MSEIQITSHVTMKLRSGVNVLDRLRKGTLLCQHHGITHIAQAISDGGTLWIRVQDLITAGVDLSSLDPLSVLTEFPDCPEEDRLELLKVALENTTHLEITRRDVVYKCLFGYVLNVVKNSGYQIRLLRTLLDSGVDIYDSTGTLFKFPFTQADRTGLIAFYYIDKSAAQEILLDYLATKTYGVRRRIYIQLGIIPQVHFFYDAVPKTDKQLFILTQMYSLDCIPLRVISAELPTDTRVLTALRNRAAQICLDAQQTVSEVNKILIAGNKRVETEIKSDSESECECDSDSDSDSETGSDRESLKRQRK